MKTTLKLKKERIRARDLKKHWKWRIFISLYCLQCICI